MDDQRDPEPQPGTQSTAAWVIGGLAAAFNFAARVADPQVARFVDEMSEEAEQRERAALLRTLGELDGVLQALALSPHASQDERAAFAEAEAGAGRLVARAKQAPTAAALKQAQAGVEAVRLLAQAEQERTSKRAAGLEQLSVDLAKLELHRWASSDERDAESVPRVAAGAAISKGLSAPTIEALVEARTHVALVKKAVEDAGATLVLRRARLEELDAAVKARSKADPHASGEEQKQLAAAGRKASQVVAARIDGPTAEAVVAIEEALAELTAEAERLGDAVADRKADMKALSDKLDNLARPKGLLSVAQEMNRSALQKSIAVAAKMIRPRAAPDEVEAAAMAVARAESEFVDLVKQVEDIMRGQIDDLGRKVAVLDAGDGPKGEEVQAVAQAQGCIVNLGRFRADVAACDFSPGGPVDTLLQKTFLPLDKRLAILIKKRTAAPPMTPQEFAAWSRARVLRYFQVNVPIKTANSPWLGRQGGVLEVTVDWRDRVLWQQIHDEFDGREVPTAGKTYNGRPMDGRRVTYYVTRSSNSGFAFDISGHIWSGGTEIMSAIFVLHVTNRAETYVQTEVDAGRL